MKENTLFWPNLVFALLGQLKMFASALLEEIWWLYYIHAIMMYSQISVLACTRSKRNSVDLHIKLFQVCI